MPTALVTGAGRGIGRAITERLAGAGWTVFAGVRTDAGRERPLEGRGRITPVLLDITDQTHIDALSGALPRPHRCGGQQRRHRGARTRRGGLDD